LDFVRKEEILGKEEDNAFLPLPEIENRVDTAEALNNENLVKDITDDIDSVKIEYKSDIARCAMNGDAIKAASSANNGELSRNVNIEEHLESNFTQNKHSFYSNDDMKIQRNRREKRL